MVLNHYLKKNNKKLTEELDFLYHKTAMVCIAQVIAIV